MLKKGKLLVSLVMLMLVVWAFGSVSSLATDITANTVTNTPVITTITATPTNNTANTSTNTNTNTANKVNTATISGTVINNTTNSSRYNTTNSTSLPYAGSNSSVIFVVLAFVASAIYAYKKVSEYNV